MQNITLTLNAGTPEFRAVWDALQSYVDNTEEAVEFMEDGIEAPDRLMMETFNAARTILDTLNRSMAL